MCRLTLAASPRRFDPFAVPRSPRAVTCSAKLRVFPRGHAGDLLPRTLPPCACLCGYGPRPKAPTRSERLLPCPSFSVGPPGLSRSQGEAGTGFSACTPAGICPASPSTRGCRTRWDSPHGARPVRPALSVQLTGIAVVLRRFRCAVRRRVTVAALFLTTGGNRTHTSP